MPNADEGQEYEIEPATASGKSRWERFTAAFNRQFNRMLDIYEYWVNRALVRPGSRWRC